MAIIENKKLLVLLAFFNIYVIWGTTFLAISYGLKGFPPFILSGLRFFIAGCILFFFLRLKGEKAGQFSDWIRNGISGILILTVGVGAVTWAEQYITSTEAAILTASEPFWFIILDRTNHTFYRKNKLAISGLVIGFTGLIIFFRDSLFGLSSSLAHSGISEMRNTAFVLLIFSAIIWVIGSLFSKKETKSSLQMNVTQQLIVGGVVSLLFASFKGEWHSLDLNSIPTVAWIGLFYLIVFGSILAYLSFIWLLSVRPAALVSTHTFINPIVAVVVGYFIAHEVITSGQITGLFVIIIGVILTNIAQYQLSKRKKVKIRRAVRSLFRLRSAYRYNSI